MTEIAVMTARRRGPSDGDPAGIADSAAGAGGLLAGTMDPSGARLAGVSLAPQEDVWENHDV
jgi:hypothetical protein